MKDLTELLTMARRHAAMTGQGAEEYAPGVCAAEAHVAAWHAIVVQGGSATPQREAWRLSADYGRVTRAEADAAQYSEGPVDTGLVAQIVGTVELAAGLAVAMERSQGAPQLNDRGEYTGTDGKLYHRVPHVGLDAIHEGEWLACDGCNPPVVVNTDYMPTVGDLSLSELRARYDDLKKVRDAAVEEFDTAKSALQHALGEASGGAYRSTLLVPGYRPMTLIYTEPWRVDSKRLKAEQPAIYVQYAKQGSQWTLAESRAKS